MRHAHQDVSTRPRRPLVRARAPLALGVIAAFVAVAGSANAQVGSANVPLPNVMLLLDTSGSFEHMIDGSNPEDTTAGPFNTNAYGNNNYGVSPPQLGNCEAAWAAGVPALPNRWGHVMQALTGTVLNAAGSAPFYSCVTMDRQTGPAPTSTTKVGDAAIVNGVAASAVVTGAAPANGLDIQYGIQDTTGTFYYPYDSGYYLPFHRPVSAQSPAVPGPLALPTQRCVYSPQNLPGGGAVGPFSGSGGALSSVSPTAFPNSSGYSATNAIGQFLYDSYPVGQSLPTTFPTTAGWAPNFGYSSNTAQCTFNQASDGIIDQASTLVRFGLMTFDNDPSGSTGMQSSAILTGTTPPLQPDNTSVLPLTMVPAPYSPFAGQWSYDSVWTTTNQTTGPNAPTPWSSPALGLPAGCDGGATAFQVGARNPAAPPWEGRLIGFPNPNADVNAVGQSNMLVQTAINAMRPYGATPTAGLMQAAEYYYWADPNGPGPQGTTVDGYAANGCRSQYIILLTDGGPNLDLRPQCQGATEPTPGGGAATAASGLCPFQLPEDTASVLANGVPDVQTGVQPGAPVFTYVIGFAVSGNVAPTNAVDAGTYAVSGTVEGGLANCAALAQSGALATQCLTGNPVGTGGGVYNPVGTGNGAVTLLQQQQNAPTSTADGGTATLESPCCSLQRIAVAGGTQHAYFADTPGDLNAALAAVLGDITGQLGSRTLPVASPSVTYSGSGPLTATYTSSFTSATCPSGFVGTYGQCLVPWQSNGPWAGDVVRQQYTCQAGGALPFSEAGDGDDFGADVTAENTTGRNFLFFNGWTNGTLASTNALTIRPWLDWAGGVASGNVIGNAAAVPPPADNLDEFITLQTGAEVNNFGAGPNIIYTQLNGLLPGTPGAALAIQTNSCQDPATGTYLDQATCANLALSFAMAQPTVPAGNPGAGQSLAVNNVISEYASGLNGIAPTNRAGAPLGAIIDSTPAVVAVPGAQVRDDSYQAFASALSLATALQYKKTPRDTMLYVATVDGLLHAFDTTAGLQPEGVPTAVAANLAESWSFIPPAVLPRLISEYPGGGNIALDGSPVVKDVIFSRCQTGAACGASPETQWVNDWHTMLVAGFGLGGPGYYAMDVTDPRPPTGSATKPPTYPTLPSYIDSSASPPSLQNVGPHFQWQITAINTSGVSSLTGVVPTRIFGNISGTPAIGTVYADPTLVNQAVGTLGTPQEIGIAILPGGHDGLPTPGLICARELAQHSTAYTTGSGNWPVQAAAGLATSAYNVSDVAFPPRANVRGWAANCTGSNSAVPGRSVMVVAVATGQVLAVFARAPPASWPASPTGLTNDPTAWDVPSNGSGAPLISQAYLVPTPLDSPMTGKPVIYPSGVGVVAQAAYIGDADGTLWRFDLSDPNPANWTGAIFADAYAPNADSGSGYQSAGTPTPTNTDWTALDSQAIAVEPQISLDSSANVVVNFATGDQTAFNACYSAVGTTTTDGTSNSGCAAASGATGSLNPVVNFVYSVSEQRGSQASSGMTTPYHALVNWYQAFGTNGSTGHLPGERVTGPMAVFNGILYFATYTPPNGTGNTCLEGGPALYAWDFEAAATLGSPGSGAAFLKNGILLDASFTTPPGEINAATLESQYGLTVISNTTVIPGVSIASTPSCTTTSTIPQDAYTGQAHTETTAPIAGTYSLMANLGRGHPPAGGNLLTKAIQAPATPTIVDSWAAVSE